MELAANILGILAVLTFAGSYLLKTRRNLILCNAASRILYVSQYLLLFAYEGALLDIVALFVTLIYKRCIGFSRRALILTVVLSNLAIIGLGMITYKNVYSLLPIVGVIFETLALIPRSEKRIRLISLFGAPFWLAYNLICHAYGSAAGNVITLAMIVCAMLRYDFKREQKNGDIPSPLSSNSLD